MNVFDTAKTIGFIGGIVVALILYSNNVDNSTITISNKNLAKEAD